MRNVALLVAAIAMVTGCSPTPSAPTTATPPAATFTVGTALQHVVAGPLGLDIPAGWRQRAGSVNPGGNETFLFVGPVDLPSDCQETAQGGTCFAWPILQLAPGGIVVAVRFYGRPGFQPPAGGEPVRVAGLAGRRLAGSADGACRGIGGTDLVEVWLPAFEGANGRYSIDACSSGQDGAPAATFAAIVASVTFTSAAPPS